MFEVQRFVFGAKPRNTRISSKRTRKKLKL